MAAAVLLPRLLDLDSYRPQILSALEKSLKRPVSYATASFSHQLIPSIVVNGITIKEKTGDANLLTADRLTFRLGLLPLLHKEVRLEGIVLERPVLTLSRDQAGVFSISDLFSGPPSAYDLQINDIQIRNGLIRFTDRMSDCDVLAISLEELDLQIHGLTRGDSSTFTLRTTVIDQWGRSELNLSGSAGIPARDLSFREAKLDVTVSAKNIDTGRYWQYYGRFLPFERIQGALDIQGVFKGTLQDFATKGSLSVRGLRLNYPRVFHGLIAPKQVDLSYDLALTPADLSAKSIALKVDGLQVKGDLVLKDMHGNDPHLTVRVDSSPFRLEEVGSYIPYGVIPRGTADFIEKHIKGGTFKVLEGRLDGRISQILHMEQGTNYNALLVRATVDKGLMSFGRQVPAISAIKGGLEFRGKDFILSGMTGNFGRSPFTLEGRIADYPLKTPANYPVTVSITPAQTEVAWLLRQEKPGQMAFGGPSLLRLSGSGIASDYKLSGSWDLSRADYQFGRQLHKPAGLTNRIGFSATLGTAEARLTELHYELPPLNVTATAVYRYDDPRPLSCTVATNRFDVGAILPVIPALNQYHPTGRLQAAVTATGNPAASDSLDWKGAASVTDLSLRPSAQVSALKHINGTLNLSGTVLELTQLSGQLGNSDLTATGRVSGFSNPAVELAIASTALHLSDLGFRSPGQDPLLKGCAANLSLKSGGLTIASLTGQLSSTSFSVQGTIPDINNPEISLRAHFPFLRVEDLQALTGLKPPGGDADKTGDVALKIRVTAEAGSVREMPFAKLDTELSVNNSRLAVQALSVDVFGGTVSGSGTVDPGSGGVPSYQAQYRLVRVDAAQLSKAAGVERAISGKLTAEGELKVQGKDRADLKKSAVVTAKVHLQDGLLSNPKEMGEKIPYRVLDANLSFNRGALSIQGLNAEVFGGTVSGSGTLDPSFAAGPLYQAQYRLERVDAEQLSKAAGVKLGITGQLSTNGDLTMQGSSLDGLRKTARGSADVELNNGTLALAVAVEKKSVLEIPFKTIRGRLAFEKDMLTVQSAKIDVFDGVVFGTGAADVTIPYKPGYRVSFTATSIDVDLLDQAFGFKSDISGRLALKGELTASGEGQAALKKTLQGALVMRMEDGTLNKFSAISKIFSLLNVSQLFKLRLPDMFSTGMPYDVISGNFSFSDGIAVTSDLAIDSPSIKMRVVGNSDLVRKEIDLTAAVQPLQTIGMIISRIPVIGWILTGNDNSFLITYYKVKGNWSDPAVTSANISELPQSVFNVFRRVYTLPENIFTNTGNVFLGN
jgi:uncharacterized protein involved in outer membrane biogenesis